MNRNLDRRIELMFPILDKAAFEDVKSILDTYFADNTSAMELQANGSWTPVERGKKEEAVRAQEVLYKKYKLLEEKKPKGEESRFEVRRK